jgi:hypothetical protein
LAGLTIKLTAGPKHGAHEAEIVLGSGVSLLGTLAEPLHGLGVVPRYAAVGLPQPTPSLGLKHGGPPDLSDIEPTWTPAVRFSGRLLGCRLRPTVLTHRTRRR